MKTKLAEFTINLIQPDHLLIGIGSGTTINELIKILPQREYISASSQTSINLHMREVIERSDFNTTHVDLFIDGADQILERKYVIKGRGGALTREKILWESSPSVWILATEDKFVDSTLKPIPIEIVPFAIELTKQRLMDELKNLGVFELNLRRTIEGLPFQTDNSNYIFDLEVETLNINLKDLYHKIKLVVGVVEIGIFFITSNKDFKFISSRDGDVFIIKPQL